MKQLGKVLVSTTLGIAFSIVGTTAQAQTNDETSDESLEEIIVTGTHIKGATVTAALPVTVVTQEDLISIGGIDGDDLFRALPSQGAVDFREDNSGTVNSARGDVASINLRSLGPGNTLVLLNGRRMVNHPGTQTKNLVPAVTVNTNAIPISGIQRVEVLHDGAAALYGSDAVAGVVNTILRTDRDGFSASFRHGFSEGTDLAEEQLNLFGGWDINGGDTNISFFASYSTRDGMFARERPYSANADQRDFLIGTSFEGDTSFRNLSSRTPWGQFTLRTTSATRVAQNGDNLTTSSGRFHIQPSSVAGCRGTTATDLATPGICIDDSSLNAELRYNPGAFRQLISDRDRVNLFGFVNHQLDNGMEFFGEIGYYTATTNTAALQNTSIGSGEIAVPANNYWNPFGPVTFADGSPNPNRLPGLSNVPVEGLPVFVDGARFRLVDVGQRRVEVKNEVYRILGGLRGELGNWSWESAALYSEASTDDVTGNRVSSTLFQQALNNETPTAYNMFNGGDPNDPNSGDITLNPQSAIDPFLISVQRKSETALGLIDFKVSRHDLFSLFSNDVGAAFGAEVRRESYVEDRDSRLDGTITYTDMVTGTVSGSDVMGTSPTSDSSGSRVVYSLFGELLFPLISEDQSVPLVRSLDVQLAARVEEYTDIGNSGVKPRVSVSWSPAEWLQLRSSWSEGFRAPNLLTINEVSVARTNTRTDNIFCEAGVRNGTFATFADCDGFSAPIEEQRSGNQNLDPEDDENVTVGLVLRPINLSGFGSFLNNLVVTVDWWRIEQENVVGIFGGGNNMDLDYALRVQGSSNPDVVRMDPDVDDIAFFAGTGIDAAGEILFIRDQYVNLLPRRLQGVDFGLYYSVDDTPLGSIDIKLNAARMDRFFIDPSSRDNVVNDAIDAGLVDESVRLANSGSILAQNGQPEWRGSGRFGFNHPSGFGAGFRVNYVGGYVDTSAGLDPDDNNFFVDEWITYNVYLQYETGDSVGFLSNTRFRVGANNITDEEPPFLDDVDGYDAGNASMRQRYIYFQVSKEF